ncbi:ATP-binding protein [Thermococcus barossii]|uniref:ATPase n=1 Tax=Thermococcus barossii TaxID=54077 RepID=A0A2Z2MH89_9EURY|nr:ATP-binding protein [Thermococcus barossii]ASJ05286.1 ATPase [Thermococcus barossii]
MISLREITEEYVGSLRFVEEIEREVPLPAGSDIKAIIGPRRVGKTFLLLKRVEELRERENVLYVPFDEPELRGLDAREFAEMVRAEFPEGRVTLLLDEVQEWGDWDVKLRWLHDVKDFDIYVSGSSSALMSSEIPSRLRGRHVSRLVLPLSFREVAGKKPGTFRERGRVRNLMGDYLRWGGFPEVWRSRSREKIISILETMFYRDMVERFAFRDVREFREAFYHILSLYGGYFTYRSLQRALRGLGVDANVKTVMNYLRAMEEAFLVFQLPLFAPSMRTIMRSPRKLYLVDTAFANLFFKGLEEGRRIENIVFIELLREKSYWRPEIELSYYSDGDVEVDFVVRAGGRVEELVQVTYELNASNYGREVLGLVKAGKRLGAERLTLVTLDSDETIREGGKTVQVTPLWRFLLRERQSLSQAAPCSS